MRSTCGIFNRVFILIVLVTVLPFSAGGVTENAVPSEGPPAFMSYEAYLTDSNGKVLPDGEYDFSFALYDCLEGGSPVWQEHHPRVFVEGGLVRLHLGKGMPARPMNIPFDRQYYLGVRIDDEAEMVPRLELATTPYSFRARVADTVPDGSITDEKIASVSWAKLTDVPESEDVLGKGAPGVHSNVWSQFGNAGTDPTEDFLGTTDSTALVIRTDDTVRVTVEATGDVDVARNLQVHFDARVGDNLDVGNDAAVGEDLRVDGNLDVMGLTHLQNATESDSTDSGALVVDGGTGIGGNLNVGGGANLDSTLNVAGPTHITDQTYSNNYTEGALVVDGGVGIRGRLNVLGRMSTSSTTHMPGLKVEGGGHLGPNYEHVAEFRNVYGYGDGIAIVIETDTTTSENNFVSFYRGDSLAGRIEGFDYMYDYWDNEDIYLDFPLPDDVNDIPDYLWNNYGINFSGVFDWGFIADMDEFGLSVGSFPTPNFNPGSLPYLSMSFSWTSGLSWSWNAGSLPSLSFSGGSWPSLSHPDFNEMPDFSILRMVITNIPFMEEIAHWSYERGYDHLITASPFDLLMILAIVEDMAIANDGGVTYASHGADYAEWLPKLDPEEKMSLGQIVGVHGGRVTRTTEGADQMMAVSVAPIVLGNMPPEGKEEDYAKVGFMGQVQVLVRGEVELGDYIVPSGNNDGIGAALSEEELGLEHLTQVLGRAWSESTNDRLSMINVAVGVGAHEFAGVIEKHQTRIEELESRVAELSELESKVEKLVSLLDESGVKYAAKGAGGE